jgi:hypothetical protein
MWRAFGEIQNMVEKLIGILPRFVFFQDGVEYILLRLLTLAAHVFWRNDFGIHIDWIIIKNNNLVNAKDSRGARNATDLHSLVVRLLGIVEPASGECNADGPVTSSSWLEKSSWSRRIQIGFFIFLLLGWAVITFVFAVLVDDDRRGFALLSLRQTFHPITLNPAQVSIHSHSPCSRLPLNSRPSSPSASYSPRYYRCNPTSRNLSLLATWP